jgi:hypothetical protein
MRTVPQRGWVFLASACLTMLLSAGLSGAETGTAPEMPVSTTVPKERRIAGMRVAGTGGTDSSGMAQVPMVDVVPNGETGSASSPIGSDEWLIAPIPGYNPVMGATLAVGVGKLYRPTGSENEPRPWTTGGGFFGAENRSWGVGVGHKMGLGLDTWRLSGGAAYGDLIYRFYGIGNEAGENDRYITLNHRALAGKISLLRKLSSRWFAGANLGAIDSRVQIVDDEVPPEVDLPPGLEDPVVTFSPLLVSFAPRLQYDSRNSEYYPTGGVLFDVKVGILSESLGSDFDFRTYEIAYNQYFSWSEDDVLGIRFFGRLAEGDVPFFALSSLGQGSDLRGYTPGRYRDNALLTIQAEYRRRLSARWGAVAFLGVGGVGPTLGAIGQALPAGGVGLRFVLAEENHVAMRLDAAWGRDDSAIYLTVGEAF